MYYLILSETAGSVYDDDDWDASPPVDIFHGFTGNQQVMALTVSQAPLQSQSQPAPVTNTQPAPVTNTQRQQHANNNNQVLPSYSAPMSFQSSDPEAMRHIGMLTAQTQELKRRLDLADRVAPKKLKESRKDEEGEYEDPDYGSEANWVILRDQDGQLAKDDGLKRLDLMALRMKLRPPNADPATWGWGTFDCRLSLPRRASTLNLEHIQGPKV